MSRRFRKNLTVIFRLVGAFSVRLINKYNFIMEHAKAEEQSESLQTSLDGGNIVTDLWVEQYGDILYRFALVRVQCPATSEDLVQETFVAALKSQNSFRSQSSHQTWLIGILMHKIMDHFRSQGKTVSIEETTLTCSKTSEDSGQTEPNKIPIKEWDVTPEKMVEDRAFRETLQKCPDRLGRG